MERFWCRVSGLEASPTMGSGSPEQAETQRVSSDWISNHVACYSHIHFMDREQSRARLLRNSVGLDRVHDSLLSLNALKRCPMLCVNRPSIARMPVWTFGARRNKNAPRNNHGGDTVPAGLALILGLLLWFGVTMGTKDWTLVFSGACAVLVGGILLYGLTQRFLSRLSHGV